MVKFLFGWTEDLVVEMARELNPRPYEELAANGIELITFGTCKADININMLEQNFSFIYAELKSRNFSPDVAVIATGGYAFILEGIEQAPFPIYLIDLEWCFTAWHLLGAKARVDYLMANLDVSKQYVKRISGKDAIGISIPFWDENEVFKPLPDIPKIYDIAYVGNINPRVYPVRTKFFERLAALPEKYNIFIGNTFTPDLVINFEETNLINNQAKICINYSHPMIKSVNSRITHTLLSGAFLLTEHLDDEGYFMLEDGVNCAFFNEDNLEEKILYYLEHDEERQQIAQNGMRLARSRIFYFVNILIRLFKSNIFCTSNENITTRSFTNMPRRDQLNLLGKEAIYSIVTKERGVLKAYNYFQQAFAIDPNSPEILNNLGVVSVLINLREPALNAFKEARKLAGLDVIALFNELCLYGKLEERTNFYEIAPKLDDLLDCPDKDLPEIFPHTGLVLACYLDFFSMLKWQELCYLYFENGEPPLQFYLQAKNYILWHLNKWMAELLSAQKQFSSAIAYYKEAVELVPDSDQIFFDLGSSQLQAGDLQGGKTSLQKCLDVNPFNCQGAFDLCKVLIAAGEIDASKTIASKYILMCKRVRPFNKMAEYFEGFLASCR